MGKNSEELTFHGARSLNQDLCKMCRIAFTLGQLLEFIWRQDDADFFLGSRSSFLCLATADHNIQEIFAARMI